jgi:hypothetical protein
MRIIYIFFIAIFITSCATKTSLKTGLDEKLLREGNRLLWEAKKKGDWDAVKELVDPDLREKLTPYLDSLKGSPPMAELISCNIKEIKIEGNKATIRSIINLKWKHPLLDSLPVQEKEIMDEWVKKEGTWYLLMKRPELSEFLDSIGQKKEGGED